MKNSLKLINRLKKNWLRILFSALTVIWVALLWFPVYWLVVSATKDPIESYRNPPSFSFVLPKDYTVYLDATGVDGYGEEQFKYEAIIVSWMLTDRKMNLNLNSVQVAWCVDGKVLGTAKLNYSTFKKYKTDDIFVGNVNQERISIWKATGHERYARLVLFMQKDGYKTGALGDVPSSFAVTEYTRTINEWIEKVADKTDQTLSDFERIELSSRFLGVKQAGNFLGLFRNFIDAWNYSDNTDYSFAKFIGNSLFLAAVQIILVLIVNGLAGYALSYLVENKKVNGALTLFFIMVITIPGIVKQVPLYAVLKQSALNDSYWGIWLPGAFSAVDILLFRAYFSQIPKDLREAAKIDGASERYIFTRIMLPLAIPVFGAIAIMCFGGSWNGFFWPNLVLDSGEKFTFPLIIQRAMSIETGGMRNYSVSLAMSVIACIPAIPIYIIMQNRLKEGLMLGGLKG